MLCSRVAAVVEKCSHGLLLQAQLVLHSAPADDTVTMLLGLVFCLICEWVGKQRCPVPTSMCALRTAFKLPRGSAELCRMPCLAPRSFRLALHPFHQSTARPHHRPHGPRLLSDRLRGVEVPAAV